MGSGASYHSSHSSSRFSSHDKWVEYLKENCAKVLHKDNIKDFNNVTKDTLIKIIFYSPIIVDNGIPALEDRLKEGAIKFINTPNEIGWTPIHYAAMSNIPVIYQLLIKNGADETAITEKPWSKIGMKSHSSVRDIAVFFCSDKILEILNNPVVDNKEIKIETT